MRDNPDKCDELRHFDKDSVIWVSKEKEKSHKKMMFERTIMSRGTS